MSAEQAPVSGGVDALARLQPVNDVAVSDPALKSLQQLLLKPYQARRYEDLGDRLVIRFDDRVLPNGYGGVDPVDACAPDARLAAPEVRFGGRFEIPKARPLSSTRVTVEYARSGCS